MISVCLLSFCVNLVPPNSGHLDLAEKYAALEYKCNETARQFDRLDNVLEYNVRYAIEQAMHSSMLNKVQEASKHATVLVKQAVADGNNVGDCYELFEESALNAATDSVVELQPCLIEVEQKYKDLSHSLHIEKMNGHEVASIVYKLPESCTGVSEEETYKCLKRNLGKYSEKQYYLGLRLNELEKQYQNAVWATNNAVQCIKDADKTNLVAFVNEAVDFMSQCLQSPDHV